MLMSAAVCRLRPEQIFEWGTHVGKSARVFFECAKRYKIPLQIHSIDLPDDIDHVEHPHQARGQLVRGLNNVHLHQGDGIETALSIWNSSGKKRAPLFLVDGDHSYESVLRELTTIVSNIPDASILLHDTFYQSPESEYNTGPYRAIEEVLRSMPNSYRRIDSGMGLPGMTLLYTGLRP
jgi:cephalosporin hydroxylase